MRIILEGLEHPTSKLLSQKIVRTVKRIDTEAASGGSIHREGQEVDSSRVAVGNHGRRTIIEDRFSDEKLTEFYDLGISKYQSPLNNPVTQFPHELAMRLA